MSLIQPTITTRTLKVITGLSRPISNSRYFDEKLQEKYQDLYQAYEERTEKLNDYETENEKLRSENIRLRNEIDRVMSKNDELHGTLLSKNTELEETYRKLQD